MVYRQIEKLQKMVNSLLGLCAEGKAEAALEDTDLFTQDIRYERLGVLVLKAQDGVLEDRYLKRMEKWLLCDEVAMQYYVDFQSLTAMLSNHFNPGRWLRNRVGEQYYATQ
ncbi:MAG: hypothetical protein ACYSOQ_09485 [Planctomycetota bacterium]|jgi:hypothetical protein